jgi:hypothetical protein
MSALSSRATRFKKELNVKEKKKQKEAKDKR